MANFRTKARAIDLLGRNQIADLPTAITELWKNGYDAYGDYLDAGLYRAGYKDVKYDIFTISDDGFGMNESDILNKWIVIGTDNKKNSDNFIPLEDRFGKEERVPLGEKGIGRLSVTYLGNHMLMITKKLNQPFQLVFMNWKALENYQLYLDEVEIPTAEILNLEQINEKYQYLQELYLENFQSESWKNFINLKEDILSEIAKYKNVPTAVMKKVQNHFQEKGHGTYFIIFDPINEIVDLEKEQESNLKEEQEDISEQTKYVRSALSGLFNPFDKKLLEERKNILGEDIGKTPSFKDQQENIIHVMTNEFPAGSGKKTYAQCVFIEKDDSDYKPAKSFAEMLANNDFYNILKELVDFGISRYKRDYSKTYGQTDLVLYQKYTYEDVCRLLNWEQNEVPLNIGGYKFDKKTKTFPVFINYDKAENISDTTRYEDHFVPGFRDRLIAISKSGRSMQSEDVQNFLKAKERGIQVELFVRKNKDDKISKEFYYLGHMTASGNAKEFTMANTEKTAVEIEWILDVPVREDIYEYIVNA